MSDDEIRLGFLEGVEVDVDAELESLPLRLDDVLRLRPGSVLELSDEPGSPLHVKVGGSRIGSAEAVLIGSKRGMEITEI